VDPDTLFPGYTDGEGRRTPRADIDPYYNSSTEGIRFYDKYQDPSEQTGLLPTSPIRVNRAKRPQTLVDRFRGKYRE
jgi:hypothetical protein